MIQSRTLLRVAILPGPRSLAFRAIAFGGLRRVIGVDVRHVHCGSAFVAAVVVRLGLRVRLVVPDGLQHALHLVVDSFVLWHEGLAEETDG